MDDILERQKISPEDAILVSSHQQAIEAFNNNTYSGVILNITSISDLKLIKFINQHDPNLKVHLYGDNLLNELIPIIKNSNVKML